MLTFCRSLFFIVVLLLFLVIALLPLLSLLDFDRSVFQDSWEELLPRARTEFGYEVGLRYMSLG